MHPTEALRTTSPRWPDTRRTRSYHASLGAGIDGLTIREHEMRQPDPGEVKIRVQACSLNFRELTILRGWYPLPIKADIVPVSDGAGEVVEIGEGVSRVAVGDRVTASIFPRWLDAAGQPSSPHSSVGRSTGC